MVETRSSSKGIAPFPIIPFRASKAFYVKENSVTGGLNSTFQIL